MKFRSVTVVVDGKRQNEKKNGNNSDWIEINSNIYECVFSKQKLFLSKSMRLMGICYVWNAILMLQQTILLRYGIQINNC